MKVRGYQVAPAELEGFLLLHPDVVDVCVVSIPDEYSGELPLAFIVLGTDAQKRVRGDQRASVDLKKAIQKVLIFRSINSSQSDILMSFLISMSLMQRCNTNGSLAVWSLSTLYLKTLLERL